MNTLYHINLSNYQNSARIKCLSVIVNVYLYLALYKTNIHVPEQYQREGSPPRPADSGAQARGPWSSPAETLTTTTKKL